MTTKTLRFLELLHAGEVAPGEIDDFIDAWHLDAGNHVRLHVHLGLTWDEFTGWVWNGRLPTAREHDQARWDQLLMTCNGEKTLVRVHPPVRCRPTCPVHWPSDHPLAGAPMIWDEREGLIRRQCRHDVIHPDPDDRQVRLYPELAKHDCDGCCVARVVDGDCYEAATALESGGSR